MDESIKILIVDDTPENIDTLGTLLGNYKRMVALSGEKALALAVKDPKPDLILLDIMMPGIDGYEVCRRLKADKATRNIPIIFLTSKTNREDILKGFEIGAQDYVTKPFDKNELLARVKTQVELKKSREELNILNSALEKKVEERTLELYESNEKLKKAYNELKVMDETKNQFLHLISHELRTPLNGIVGALHLIKEEVATKKMAEFVDILDVSVKRLEKFSYQALKITQLKTGKYRLMVTEVKLKKLIEFVLINLIGLINEKHITVDVSSNMAQEKIECDYDLMTLALSKIVENALKHSPINGRIEIKFDSDEGSKIIKIRDHGVGFSQKTLANPFELFSTGEEHINNNMGVDLALVKLIIDAHKGDISVGNSNDGGAFVKINFVRLE